MLTASFSILTAGSAPVDPTVVGAQLQADAIVRGAQIGAQATIRAGWLTFYAALFALFGALAVYLNGLKDRQERARSEVQAKADRKGIIAQTFLGELLSLKSFLQANDVTKTLLWAAASRGEWHFHPGTEWLKTYTNDPTTIGVFDGDIPASLSSFYCEMLNELGRLRWLHDLDHRVIDADTWSMELNRSAYSLAALINKMEQIIPTLTSEVRKASAGQRRSRQSSFRAALTSQDTTVWGVRIRSVSAFRRENG